MKTTVRNALVALLALATLTGCSMMTIRDPLRENFEERIPPDILAADVGVADVQIEGSLSQQYDYSIRVSLTMKDRELTQAQFDEICRITSSHLHFVGTFTASGVSFSFRHSPGVAITPLDLTEEYTTWYETGEPGGWVDEQPQDTALRVWLNWEDSLECRDR